MSRFIMLVALVALVPAAPQAQQKMNSDQQKMMQEMQKDLQNIKPKDFAQWMHHANEGEIKTAQLAVERAQSPQVKQFAQMLMDDHTSANKQLDQMAQQWKMDLKGMPPMGKGMKTWDKVMQDTYDALQQMPPDRFDSTFLGSMVMNHDMTIGYLQMVAPYLQQAKGKDAAAGPALAQMATQMLPKLKQHRTMAYKLLGEAGPAQASSSGYPTQPGMGTMPPSGQGSARTGSPTPPAPKQDAQPYNH